ncbi:MAG: hypothetical protein K2N43_05175 [Lachnospiraceae bacterium]|nr:hypothetical protein [Lachnospiraceae bacterium]
MRISRKRLWLIGGIVNLILLVSVGALCTSQRQEKISWDAVAADDTREWTKEGDRYIAECELPLPHRIEKGIYTVKMAYETESGSYQVYYDCAPDGKHYPAVYSDKYPLQSGQGECSFRIWINSGTDGLSLYASRKGAYEESGDGLYMESVELIRENGMSAVYETLKFGVLLLLLDGLLAAFLNREKLGRAMRENRYVVVGLGCIFMVSSISVFYNSLNDGHDLQFHLARIVGLSEELSRGKLPVRILSSWNNGYGYPVSVFYGDILLYLPAAFYMLGVPLLYAYKIYLLFIHACTVAIAYFCYKRLGGDKQIGVACTGLYCLCVNRILNVCLRAAVGEYTAFMFFPLVLLGMKEIYGGKKEEPSRYGWIFLCAGMTGIMQSHVLSVEMVCLLLGIVAVLQIRKTFRKDIFVSLVKSVAVTLCLNMGFLLPFLDYTRQEIVILRDKSEYGVQGKGLSLYELFSVGTVETGHANLSVEGLKGRFPEALGLGMILVLLLSCLALLGWKWEKAEKNQILFALGMAGISIFMSTYYFPGNRLAAIPFVRNVVSSIQFPWRFVTVSIPILTYAACLLFRKMKTVWPAEKTRWALMGICVVCALQGLQCTDMIVRNMSNYVKYDGRDMFLETATVMGGEYLFEETEIYEVCSDNSMRGENVVVSDVQREGNEITAVCEAAGDGYLEFPLFAYKHYRCVDMETGETLQDERGSNNRIRVNLPAGYQGSVKVYFATPWQWRAAEAVSLLTLIALILYIVRMGRTENGNRIKRRQNA